MAQLSTPPASAHKEGRAPGSSGKKGFLSKLLRKKSDSDEQMTPLGKLGRSFTSGSGRSTPMSQKSIGYGMGSFSSLNSVNSDKSKKQETYLHNGHYIDDNISAYDYAEDIRSESSDSSGSGTEEEHLVSLVESSESSDSNSTLHRAKNDLGHLSDVFINDVLDFKGSRENTLWDGLKHESLIHPRFLKMNKRNKHSPRAFKNLFLAQELNVEGYDSKKDFETDSIKSSSSKSSVSLDGAGDSMACNNDKVGSKPDILRAPDSKNNMNEKFVMEFSKDGRYLAAAGRDGTIMVWKVVSSPLGRLEEANYNAVHTEESKKKSKIKSAAVFHQNPVRIFKGHRHSVLSIDWSKNNFLISGSMDKMVKLWHIDRSDCLGTFQSEDFVTAVQFHPTDDRFFLSCSIDDKVRIWSILERNVTYTRDLQENVLITAASFTPDGEFCLIGGFNGIIYLLETKGLHIRKRFEIKETAKANPFHNKAGSKITGFKLYKRYDYVTQENEDPLAKWNILITTNDSKIRLVNSSLEKLVTRFKGLENNGSTIVATMTDDSKYLISGSEDHWCYIWENNNMVINNKLKRALKDFVVEGKHHMSDLRHKHKLYAKFIQKKKLLKKLNLAKFLDDNEDTEYVSNENSSYTSFHAHHSRVNVAIFAPDSTKRLLELSDDIILDLVKKGKQFNLVDSERKDLCSQRSDLSNQMHKTFDTDNDHIIVTTDQYGLIKVFRQDPAYEVRKKLIDMYKMNKNRHNSVSRERYDPRVQTEPNQNLHPLSKNGISLKTGLVRSSKSDMNTFKLKSKKTSRSVNSPNKNFPFRAKSISRTKDGIDSQLFNHTNSSSSTF